MSCFKRLAQLLEPEHEARYLVCPNNNSGVRERKGLLSLLRVPMERRMDDQSFFVNTAHHAGNSRRSQTKAAFERL